MRKSSRSRTAAWETGGSGAATLTCHPRSPAGRRAPAPSVRSSSYRRTPGALSSVVGSSDPSLTIFPKASRPGPSGAVGRYASHLPAFAQHSSGSRSSRCFSGYPGVAMTQPDGFLPVGASHAPKSSSVLPIVEWMTVWRRLPMRRRRSLTRMDGVWQGFGTLGLTTHFRRARRLLWLSFVFTVMACATNPGWLVGQLCLYEKGKFCRKCQVPFSRLIHFI